MQAGSAPDMYVMICGRVTPAQRDIIKRRCIINGLDYDKILTWLIDNHPSYHGMQKPDHCPQPILVGGFEETTNNTDTCDNSMPEVENRFEGEEMTFASRNEPTEETGPYKSNKDFIFSYLAGEKPTLLFRNGDCVGGHKLKLVDIFPLIFPYGSGGPDEIRTTQVSQTAALRHYCRIALPQMQEPQFLLVVCSMWQRIESFTKCIINCKSNFKDSTLADSLSQLTQHQVQRAAKQVLNGDQTDNETLKTIW